MVFVITGDGKGKTTAAMGMVARALGRALECSVYQFIKEKPENTGEFEVFNKLGVEWKNYGNGFTWNDENPVLTAEKCMLGWNEFKREALEGKTDLMILDEFTYVVENGYIQIDEIVNFIESNRNKCGFPHVVFTGRRACSELIDIADTVSEIKDIKHHGVAVKGIEY